MGGFSGMKKNYFWYFCPLNDLTHRVVGLGGGKTIFVIFSDYCLNLVRDKDLIGNDHGKFTYK